MEQAANLIRMQQLKELMSQEAKRERMVMSVSTIEDCPEADVRRSLQPSKQKKEKGSKRSNKKGHRKHATDNHEENDETDLVNKESNESISQQLNENQDIPIDDAV